MSQRSLAERLGMTVSLVNRVIGELVDGGHLEVVDPGVRPFAYRLSAFGRDYRRRLSHAHFRSVVGSYRQVQERIRSRLRRIMREGVRRVVFYGAGEVMEVTYPLAQALGMEVVGLVDDNPDRQGKRKGSLVVRPPGALRSLMPDAVVITTFRHAGEIRARTGLGDGSEVRMVEL